MPDVMRIMHASNTSAGRAFCASALMRALGRMLAYCFIRTCDWGSGFANFLNLLTCSKIRRCENRFLYL